jgi:hypothetical protein
MADSKLWLGEHRDHLGVVLVCHAVRHHWLDFGNLSDPNLYPYLQVGALVFWALGLILHRRFLKTYKNNHDATIAAYRAVGLIHHAIQASQAGGRGWLALWNDCTLQLTRTIDVCMWSRYHWLQLYCHNRTSGQTGPMPTANCPSQCSVFQQVGTPCFQLLQPLCVRTCQLAQLLCVFCMAQPIVQMKDFAFQLRSRM